MQGKPLAAVVTAGLSKFGKREGLYSRELFIEAAKEAFDACPNLDPKDIQAVFVGQMSDSFEHQAHTGPAIAEALGLTLKPAWRIESACASSGAALAAAVMTVHSGLFDVVLVGGVEKMTHRATGEVTDILMVAADCAYEYWSGFTFPSLFALMAVAHMRKYGTTEEDMAHVAVKNHWHATMNPKAHLQREVTIEEVLSSRVVAWPLKLYDCSLISDGAACLVLTRPELAEKFTDTPVDIVGFGAATATLSLAGRDDLTTMPAAKEAARRAYSMAGIRPEDVDVAEVHDCFTIAEIIAYEDLGFCAPGEGGRLAREGETKLGGRIPVNTSGGLKAKGHPVGATGAAQACEIFLQLTGQAGRRQVEGAEIGLTHNIGGSAASAFVHVFKRR